MKKNIFLLAALATLYFSCTKVQHEAIMKSGQVATPLVVGNLSAHQFPDPGEIALTYDDGPGPGTLVLAQYLHQQHISATFFVVGSDDYDPTGGYFPNPQLNNLFANGQRIGNHTLNHQDLTDPATNVLNQVKTNQTYIDPVTKNALGYLRPPWTNWIPADETIIKSDQTLNKLVGPINFDWATGDFGDRDGSMPPYVLGQNFVDSNASLFPRGGIILMHDFNSYTIKPVDNFALQETQAIVPYLKSQGYIFVAPTKEFSTLFPLSQGSDFSDAAGWSSKSGYYGTIRTADVNGDGMADVIGRFSNGIRVALSNGTGLGPSTSWNVEFNGSNWDPPQYISTIQYADVNGDGKADLILRGSTGIRVALSTGTSFQSSTLWTTYFSDAPSQGWNTNIGYYGSLRAADVNGDGRADIVGRGAGGIYVALSTGTSFQTPTLWTTDFSDAAGWLPAYYSTTIQVADVNGDGKADIIGRGASGMAVALSTGSGFLASSIWTTSFSDAAGTYTDVGYYGAIRCGDVNGDGMADIIGRASDGLHVIFSTGHSFINDRLWTSNFSDANGWKPAYYSTTIQCGDFNGDKRTDVTGRGAVGIVGVNAP